MERRWAKRASAVALAFGAALAGMGFDLGNAAWAATVPSVVAVAVHPVVLSGIALQGPMVASAVTLYLVNPTSGIVGCSSHGPYRWFGQLRHRHSGAALSH